MKLIPKYLAQTDTFYLKNMNDTIGSHLKYPPQTLIIFFLINSDGKSHKVMSAMRKERLSEAQET